MTNPPHPFRIDPDTRCGCPLMTAPEAPSPKLRLIRVPHGAISLTEPGLAPETFADGTHLFLSKGTSRAWIFAAGTAAVFVEVTTPN